MEDKITREEVKKIVKEAFDNHDTSMIISITAFLCTMLEEKGRDPQLDMLAGYSKGQYKRAIKVIRVSQAFAGRTGRNDLEREYDKSANFIRRHCICKENAAQ